MKHNVKFFPERRKDKNGDLIKKNIPIYADIHFSGTRLFYFTGYRIDRDKFDPKKQEATKNSTGCEGRRTVSYADINRRIKKIKAALELYFQDTRTASKQQIIFLLNDICQKNNTSGTSDFWGLFDKFMLTAPMSEGRRRHFKSIKNRLQRYEQARGLRITFEGMTTDRLRDFEKYLKTGADTVPLGRNTLHSIFSLTRTFWNWSRKELKQQGKIIPYPFSSDGYTVPGESYGEPIYLTREERESLFNAALSCERLRRVRDIFLFQCFIGARVADMCKLTKDNIQNGVLSYIPHKKRDGKPVTVNVPLHPQAIKILSRYDLPDGRLLPFITDQRYNEYLKELFKKVELNRIVTRLNPSTGEPEMVKLSEIASSHMGRRTFIGNLYGKIDSGIICSMSGHIQGSRAFTRYYNVSQELQKEAISKL